MKDYNEKELGQITRRKLYINNLKFHSSFNFEEMFAAIPMAIKTTHNRALAEMLLKEATYKMEERLEGKDIKNVEELCILLKDDLLGGIKELKKSLVSHAVKLTPHVSVYESLDKSIQTEYSCDTKKRINLIT